MKVKVVSYETKKAVNDGTTLSRSQANIDNAKKIDIEISEDTKYRIEYEHGELVITKVDFDNQSISIRPCVVNQIAIK